jgi:drug/metabolite transporter (DMT)-like permease
MGHDISRLQAERSRLLNDIEKLQAQNQLLQSEHQVLLTQQQLDQQKLWAKQLAQALASQLYGILAQRLKQSGFSLQAEGQLLDGEAHDRERKTMLAVDHSVNELLVALQQDLSSHQSALSQQLDRMQTLEHQGEALLDALVSRLSDRLQAELAAAPPPQVPSSGYGQSAATPAAAPDYTPSRLDDGAVSRAAFAGDVGRSPDTSPSTLSSQPPQSASKDAAVPLPPNPRTGASADRRSAAPPPVPPNSSTRAAKFTKASGSQIGLMLILFSTLALSLHNVVVGIIGWDTSVFGLINLPRSISLNSLPNSLLILWLRMVVVVPVMWFVAKGLYPPVWRDVRAFLTARDLRQVITVIGSGFFLFSSQVLIYIAISAISPGVAVTILFMYPLVTVPLAWVLFGDRPTLLRGAVMFAILLGVILTAAPRLASATNISSIGVIAAVFSGIFFALYLISMQISFKKLHPVPVSFIQFFTIFTLASMMLLPFGVQEPPDNLMGLLIGGVVLGTLTLIGYLLNNLGVKRLGAARASIVASSGPVLTALLAFLLTPSDRTALQSIQLVGILSVTLGVVALSFERMLIQKQPKPNR